MKLGTVKLKPTFWISLPAFIVGLLLLRASTLKFSYVEIPPNAISLQKRPGELSDTYTQKIIEKEEPFPESPLFLLTGLSVVGYAGWRALAGIEKLDSEGGRVVPKKAPGTIPAPSPKPQSNRPEKPTPPPPSVPAPVVEPPVLESKPPVETPKQLETLPVALPLESLFEEAEDDFLSLPANPSGVWASPSTFEGFQLPEEEPGEWIERFIRQRHVRVAGLPGSGKSYLSIRLLQEDLAVGAKIAICDRHYMKPLRDRKTGAILLNPDGTPRLSDWNGFPRESIFCNQGDIARVIKEFRDELKERQRICRTCSPGDPELRKVIKPWFLYFDEIDATLTDFKNTGNTKVLDDLGILISEGDGFSVGVRLIGQSLACNQSQINEATNGQLCVVMLGRTAMNASEVGKLKLGKVESEALIGQVRSLNAQGKWGAIVQFKSDPAEAVSVPDLSELDQFRFDREVSPCLGDSIPTTPIKAVEDQTLNPLNKEGVAA